MGLRNQLLLDLYKDKASVFTMQGIAMAYGQGLERNTIKNRMISYVKKGEIINPRKGIYAKPGYDEKSEDAYLFTGEVRIDVDMAHSTEPRIILRHGDPLPFNILSLSYNYTVTESTGSVR